MNGETTCASPHPQRTGNGLDVHADLEIIGSYADDCWARCRVCGAWVWLTTDSSSKWQYVDGWDLDRELAERAFVHRDIAAAAQLLVSSGLPRGPIWGTSAARLDLLRAITPAATDAQRSNALDASLQLSSLASPWSEVAIVLREIATHPAVGANEIVFAVDVRLPGRTFSEAQEIGSSLVVFQDAPSPQIIRFDAHAISEFPCAGPIRFLARNDDAVLFAVTTAEGDAIHRVDAAGQVGSFAPTRTRYTVTSLDDGGWLFVPDDDAPVRFVEFHDANAFSRVKLRMAFANGSRFACAPRRMADGWIVSGCVDDHDEEQALTMFDAAFKTIAQSIGVRGQRLIVRIDDAAVWCETITPPFTLERWERHDRVLERTFAIETQSWFRADGGVVASLRSGPLVGYADSGAELFRHERDVNGATYFVGARNGVLVYDDRLARILDPKTGHDVGPPFAVESASVRVTRGGVVYLQESTALRVIADATTRLFVGEQMRLETICGEDALLRDDRGRCLIISPDGAMRTFDAPRAQFSVVGTRGGPYVVEPERVRIGRF